MELHNALLADELTHLLPIRYCLRTFGWHMGIEDYRDLGKPTR